MAQGKGGAPALPSRLVGAAAAGERCAPSGFGCLEGDATLEPPADLTWQGKGAALQWRPHPFLHPVVSVSGESPRGLFPLSEDGSPSHVVWVLLKLPLLLFVLAATSVSPLVL